MVSPLSLDLLPADILIQIMLEGDSIDTLHAFIRSTPHVYDVFRAEKRYVLTRLSRRLFHPRALFDALSVARLAELDQPLPQQTAISLLRIPQDDRQRQLLQNTFRSRCIALCRLTKQVNFFIDDYAHITLPILEHQGAGRDFRIDTKYNAGRSTPLYSLSTSEVARLQRAFCRFEVYTQLFRVCSGRTEDCTWWNESIPVGQQKELFSSNFSRLEVAEIFCVRDYLHRRLRGLLDMVEDEAVTSPREEYYKQETECNDDISCPYLFRYHDGKWNQDANIEHLMCLGLQYIREIFVKTGNERRDLMLHGSYTCCDGIQGEGFITDLLDPPTYSLSGSHSSRMCDQYNELETLIQDEDQVSIAPIWLTDWSNHSFTPGPFASDLW